MSGQKKAEEFFQGTIAAAQAQATRLQHHWVGCEHLLLAILLDGDSQAQAFLLEYGVDAHVAEIEIVRTLRSRDRPGDQELTAPLTPRARTVIELAARAGEKLAVGPSDLIFVGLLNDGSSLATSVLQRFELPPRQTRRDFLSRLDLPADVVQAYLQERDELEHFESAGAFGVPTALLEQTLVSENDVESRARDLLQHGGWIAVGNDELLQRVLVAAANAGFGVMDARHPSKAPHVFVVIAEPASREVVMCSCDLLTPEYSDWVLLSAWESGFKVPMWARQRMEQLAGAKHV